MISKTVQCQSNRGFTYVGLIILVAVIGLVAASTVKVGTLLQRSAAEEDLLEVGSAFSRALQSYAEASGPDQRRSPTSLEQLLRDPRFPNPRRHLRSLYADPITGKSEWGITFGPDRVSIVGIHSLSDAKPIKVGNFPPDLEQFANRSHVSEWVFMKKSGSTTPILIP